MKTFGTVLGFATHTGPTAPHRVPSTGLLVFRVFCGIFLIVHGVQKIANYDAFAAFVGATGWPLSGVAAALTVAGETGLGLLLLLGLGTRLAGSLLALLMALVWITVHAPHGLVIPGQPGLNGESALLYLLVGLTLATVGAGALSVDGFLRRGRTAKVTSVVGVPAVTAERRAA